MQYYFNAESKWSHTGPSPNPKAYWGLIFDSNSVFLVNRSKETFTNNSEAKCN